MAVQVNAKQFMERRNQLGSEKDEFNDVSMGQVFALAKEFIDMPPDEVEKLLESPIHKVRAGAVSIMDWQARSNKTGVERRKQLFDLYIRRHDRINDWDLVDRSAPYVVGGYLMATKLHSLTCRLHGPTTKLHNLTTKMHGVH